MPDCWLELVLVVVVVVVFISVVEKNCFQVYYYMTMCDCDVVILENVLNKIVNGNNKKEHNVGITPHNKTSISQSNVYQK